MLGWVQSVLHSAIFKMPETSISAADKIEAIVAINKVRYLDGSLRAALLTRPGSVKVIWIQNDLFSRHYIGD